MLAHYAVRGFLHEAALVANEDPDRLSFTHAVQVVRRRVQNAGASPSEASPAPSVCSSRRASGAEPRTGEATRRQDEQVQIPAPRAAVSPTAPVEAKCGPAY